MSLIGKFVTVGGATMASRVLGFVREAMIGGLLGAGPVADAFFAAFRFPNLFRRVFAEGAFNTAFIPLFARELEGDGPEAARRFAESVLSVLVFSLILLTGLAVLFMPVLVGTVVAPSFADTPEKFDLTVALTRIMFPYLFSMSLVAMLSGILNSIRRYFLAAIAPILLSVAMIVALLVAIALGANQVMTGHLISWSVCLSGFAQLGLLAWGVRRQDFLPRLRMPRLDPNVRRLLVLMAPAIVTGGVTQINLLVGQIIASAQDGAIALLNYADRINQLPLGVIGIAVGVVLLPELSRALKGGNLDEVNHLQNRSLEFALGITVPAAVGLMVMPGPIVNLLYERGAFTSETTALTAAALAAFATGLPAYVAIKVFQPAFFAREDMKTPMRFAIAQMAVNIVLSLALFPVLGHIAIALATSASAWVNVGLLAGTLWKHGNFRPSRQALWNIAKIIMAAFAMGAVVWLLLRFNAGWLGHERLLFRAMATLMTIALGATAYFAIVLATGALDRNQLLGLLRRWRRA